jgi:preprotein translocase subunit SecA
MEEGTPIEHGLISKALENAQRKVEQYHFSIRKQILEYDDVMNKQREAIYGLRKRILQGENLEGKFFEMVEQIAQELSDTFIPPKARPDEWDIEGLKTEMTELACPDFRSFTTDKSEEARSEIEAKLKSRYEERKAQMGPETMSELQRFVMLKVMDDAWIEQLHNMDALREGIGLRAWGERDPLIEYKMESFGMFNDMMSSVRRQIFSLLFKVQLVNENESIAQKAHNITYGAPQPGEAKRQPITTAAKTGRNDPCPCGSGKKYKKCCGK